MRRNLALILAVSASGCEFLEDLDDPASAGSIDVEVTTRDGVAEIAWDRGDAHIVEVLKCESGCRCLEGQYVANGQVVWEVGYDRSGTYDGNEDLEPILQSPVTYGDPELPDDVRRPAIPLEPGAAYGVTVSLLKEHGEVQDKPRASGCAEFVAE